MGENRWTLMKIGENMEDGSKGARTVVVSIINMLPDKLVMAGIIVLIL